MKNLQKNNKKNEFMSPTFEAINKFNLAYYENSPKIFVTDYESYNNGNQFLFGHWLDLTNFTDENDLYEYFEFHFKDVLKFSDYELMITDYENFPEFFYSESNLKFADLFFYLNLSDDDKIKFLFCKENYYCFETYKDDLYFYEYHQNLKYDLFNELYNIDITDFKCDYVTIDYDQFLENEFTRFDYNNKIYYFQNI